MQKRYDTIKANLAAALLDSSPVDPRGKSITKAQILAATRSLKKATENWTNALTKREEVTKREIDSFFGTKR